MKLDKITFIKSITSLEIDEQGRMKSCKRYINRSTDECDY